MTTAPNNTSTLSESVSGGVFDPTILTNENGGPTRSGRQRQRSVSSPGMFNWEETALADLVRPLERQDTKVNIEKPERPQSSSPGSLPVRKSTGATSLKSDSIFQPSSRNLHLSYGGKEEVLSKRANTGPGRVGLQGDERRLSKMLIRIKLPNNSYRTFPVLEDTTVEFIMQKIKSKMSKEKSETYGSSHLFQVNADGSEIVLNDNSLVLDILDAAEENCAFIFKKEGEKLVDRNEELKQIALENRILEKKKEIVNDAMNVWLGDSKTAGNMALAVTISEKRFPFPFLAHPNSANTDARRMVLFAQAEALTALLIEKNSASHKFSQLKKAKLSKGQHTHIDFSSGFTVVERNRVCALSRISEVITYTVVVSGWKCLMKEFFCHANDFSSAKKILFEVSLLETLPYHPNIVQFYFCDQLEKSTQLFYSYHGPSLRSFISAFNQHQPVPRSLLKAILLGISNALVHLHSYSFIHNNLTCESIFIHANHTQLVQLVIGDFCYGVQLDSPQTAIGCMSSFETLERCLAPELYQDSGSFYSQASDIYSFGMVCYELLMFKPPYEDCEGKEALMRAIKNCNEKPNCSCNLEYSPYVALYNACVDNNPKQRPNALQLKQMVWDLPTGD